MMDWGGCYNRVKFGSRCNLTIGKGFGGKISSDDAGIGSCDRIVSSSSDMAGMILCFGANEKSPYQSSQIFSWATGYYPVFAKQIHIGINIDKTIVLISY
jgi:hypothetical protein